jgi:translocation and assembly module TamB
MPALLHRLAGNGSVRVQDSVLAGVPLQARLDLSHAAQRKPDPASLRAELRVGGNELDVEAHGDPAGNGHGDRWRAELRAGDVATLAPLMRLVPSLADWQPRRGSVTATLAADGRWPALHTEGSVRVQQLQAGPLELALADARWRIDTGGRQALDVQADLAGLKWGRQPADHLRLQVAGTLADHRIDIATALPIAPPVAAERALGIVAQSGTRAQLLAQGAWQPAAAGGGRWATRIERLQIGSWDGSEITAPPASSWAEARGLRAELDFAADGRFAALRADAGRLRLADTLALRWDEVRVDLRAASPLISVRADIEPFAVAPLLARLQPAVGWQGDLTLTARLDIRAAERFDADLVIERRDGDLRLANASGAQTMGLTELKLVLSAHDGLWNLDPVLRGSRVGEVTGRVQVRATPQQSWPSADATVTGAVLANVADLGIWSAWVPPGWRLGGELRGLAVLSGRFGDPRFNGTLGASGLSVRNLLQGVNVADGEVDVRLDGDTARIERFTLRGGDGSLSLSGGASLGRSPQARLQVVADRFRVLGRVDRLVVASGRAELVLQESQARLDGKFAIDEGLFDITRADAPSLDNDVTVRRAGDEEAAAEAAAAQRPARNVVLGLEIDLGQNLRLRGRGLDTELRGQLRLTTPGGRLAVNGTISTESGTYAAYGQKLEIDRGIVAFSGGVDNPRLDVLALRPNLDVRVGVSITGNLTTPRVRLYSDPEMSDNDKLSWLLLGREPDGLGRADTALLQRAALAVVAGEGEGPTDTLLRNLGLDELSLRQGDGDARETVISLGKQLSRRWYVGYERGVNATTGTWQLIYRIAQRFTVRAQSGVDNSLDVIWTWRFQEAPADAGMRKSTLIPP